MHQKLLSINRIRLAEAKSKGNYWYTVQNLKYEIKKQYSYGETVTCS